LGLLAAGAAAGIIGLGAWRLQQADIVLPMALAETPPDLAEGARLTKVYGCSGCHGATLAGKDFYGVPAPNLTAIARRYSLEDFARLVRRGQRADGTSLTWAMPSEFFAVMADDQIRSIHAYLSSLKPQPDGVKAGWLPMKPWAVATGDLQLSAFVVRPEPAPARAPMVGDPAWPAYFTRLACAECHSYDLGGVPGGTPALADVIQRYNAAHFQRFLRTGVAAEGHEVRMMSGVARGRLKHMTDTEVAALFAWLKALPPP
jgi:cytochrome c553